MSYRHLLAFTGGIIGVSKRSMELLNYRLVLFLANMQKILFDVI